MASLSKFFDRVPVIGGSRVPAQMVSIKVKSTDEVKPLPLALNEFCKSVEEYVQENASGQIDALTQIVESNTSRIETLEEIVATVAPDHYWIDVE